MKLTVSEDTQEYTRIKGSYRGLQAYTKKLTEDTQGYRRIYRG